jgi:hypothetical protein
MQSSPQPNYLLSTIYYLPIPNPQFLKHPGMQPKSEQQQSAKDLYLQTDKSMSEIADILDIDRKTLYLWMKNGRWKEMKIAARTAPSFIEQDIVSHYMEISDSIRNRPAGQRCPTPQEVGMMYKLLRMGNMINRRHPGCYMEAYMELITFINKKNRPLAKEIIPLADQYVKALLHQNKSAEDELLEEKVKMAMEAIELDEKEEAERQKAEEQAAASASAPHTQTSKLAADNGQMWANDGAINLPTGIRPESATEATYENNYNASLPHFDNEKKLSGNGEILTDAVQKTDVQDTTAAGSSTIAQTTLDLTLSFGEGSVPPTKLAGGEAPLTALHYAALPPAMRPSPFREGNIIWVNHIDDVDDDERKMSDTICYYRDIEPGNKLAADTQQLDAEERDRKAAELALRKEKDDSILTLEEYNRYYGSVNMPVANGHQTISIEGRIRNRMAFRYNVRQMTLPENERVLLTDEEFEQKRSVDPTFGEQPQYWPYPGR